MPADVNHPSDAQDQPMLGKANARHSDDRQWSKATTIESTPEDSCLQQEEKNTFRRRSLQEMTSSGNSVAADPEKNNSLQPPSQDDTTLGSLPMSPSQQSIERAIAQKFATLGVPQKQSWRAQMDQYLLHEGPRVLFLCLWSLLQGLIFYFSFEIYNRSLHYSHVRSALGLTLGISRGAAAVINFDCALILFSVCRNLISLLRSTFLNDIVPFDKNIVFHKTVAWSIVLFSVIHSVAHYVNYYHLEMKDAADPTIPASSKRTAQSMAFFTGPGITGHLLVLILFLMVTSSVERVRRKGFEIFWYTHHLFILFFLVLMIHGMFCFIRADTEPHCRGSPGSYKFILGSLLFYILERSIREIRARQQTAISKIVLHPSKVVEVQLKKADFRAKAGQYVFLNCPELSMFEWHPFTITSAPEEDYVSVHMRIVGDWTSAFASRLGCSFDDEQQFWIEAMINGPEASGDHGSLTEGSSLSVAKNNLHSMDPTGMEAGAKSETGSGSWEGARPRTGAAVPPECIRRGMVDALTLPRVILDGPYGSPSEDAFNYEIAVLVGAGIGVTPFASVLKHIWYSVMQPTKIITLRKVYFFWVCRDRDAFEWFQDLLIALEEQNMSDFLEIRSYLTGELGAEEMNIILTEAREAAAAAAARHLRRKYRRVGTRSQGGSDDQNQGLLAKSESNESLPGRDRDAITGLRSPTYYGRPNFDRIFGELAQAHPRENGQVGVFFCGPKPLGKTIHRCARKYKFKFHKENF
ncbi:hypothetical protein BGW38_009957 [Lunasporangiospora selenospora]|uniref:FAD-binding FR-type domain-containing protein n=1 Tax=Lunasporangiospora selenospora TaxID=979761 RepID=A0A9P6FYU4_9FUNG|nr:hypothetical protein BGW38_009957 [Lunasporangiospora selenospora]